MVEKPSVAAEGAATRLSARLILCLGELRLRAIALDGNTFAIGRRPYNDLVLDDLTASGEHAVVLRDAAGHLLRDLGSRNGTRVNGEPVSHRLLRDGDLIGIGVYRLEYRRSPEPGVEGRSERASSALSSPPGGEGP